MKKVIVSASAIALLAGFLTLTRDAWSEPSKPAAGAVEPHKVALIDMAYVFKNYTKFETLREELKAEIQSSEEKAKATQQETARMQQEMKTFTEGSPEYTKAEKALVKMAAEFEGFRREKSREFLKKESQIYLQVYNEVSEMVKNYAQHFGYTLVMRFNRDDLDTENPQQILQNMNRQVVYYREDDDITQKILAALNKKLNKDTPAATKPARATDEAKRPAPTTKK
ncbi:OmpH family outer membrane protein [Schlesneria paludicola]|uniref:OmpH family outer membrane protein n=1 Tax=Schlesneria paludicola TaxID=360056 RepID=UPI00029AF168|nr:OmpH family outer membrane protein [Schlesneria paludicola]